MRHDDRGGMGLENLAFWCLVVELTRETAVFRFTWIKRKKECEIAKGTRVFFAHIKI